MLDGDSKDGEFDLGARVRLLRKGHRLSQRRLAARSGVSNATISLIEANRMSPSVGLLKRILDGIPISLSAFFAREPAKPDDCFFSSHELVEIGAGAISLRQVGADLKNRRLQIMHERFAVGADTGELMLGHEGEEGGLVIQGHLEVTVSLSTRVLRPGDAYCFDSRLPHRFRNVGPDECIVVSACTPPSF